MDKFAQKAVNRFETNCSTEAATVGEADQEAAEERLRLLLAGGGRSRLLGGALLGADEFKAVLLGSAATPLPATMLSYQGLSEDGRGYLVALVGLTHGMVLEFAQRSEVIGLASTDALRMIASAVAQRPTLDQVQVMIQQAVTAELERRPEQIIAGERPRLASWFVARDEMPRLREALTGEGVASLCALEGMRGVGKSQIASAFAQGCEEAGWSFVMWVTAPNRQQAVTELAAVARRIKVSHEDDQTKAALDLVGWLNSNGPEERLLVFDNVENLDDLERLVPRGSGMRVLITTTSRRDAVECRINVEAYSLDQAVDYLIRVTGHDDRDGAAAVATDLERLPVAITQAATTMRLLDFGYAKYRQLLVERALDEALRRKDGDPYPATVGAALRIAYTTVVERLTEANQVVGGAAQAVLEVVSLLAESGVPREWIYAITGDELAGREAVGQLIIASVLVESGDRATTATISLHRLVARVVREDATIGGRPAAVVTLAIEILPSNHRNATVPATGGGRGTDGRMTSLCPESGSECSSDSLASHG